AGVVLEVVELDRLRAALLREAALEEAVARALHRRVLREIGGERVVDVRDRLEAVDRRVAVRVLRDVAREEAHVRAHVDDPAARREPDAGLEVLGDLTRDLARVHARALWR